ncbi:hypothetical protein [Achromobacter sp. DH1f]|uniref:hypothetical protein n=1 Tax=Achromobacter sp. DH1f TaxID=1397275 RepID=UPI0012FF06BA|nr:hypothetical protein [Achromobacter sp. DH1f]
MTTEGQQTDVTGAEAETAPSTAARTKRRGRFTRSVVWSARTVGRPYLEAGKSAKRLKDTLRRLGRSVAGGADPGGDANYVDAPDAAAAFERLYKLNGWSKAGLQQQRTAVVRAKFVALLLAILFFAVTVFGVLTLGHHHYVAVAMALVGLAITTLGLSLFVHHAIWQTQIDERRLLSAREFFSHPDRWAYLFSS